MLSRISVKSVQICIFHAHNRRNVLYFAQGGRMGYLACRWQFASLLYSQATNFAWNEIFNRIITDLSVLHYTDFRASAGPPRILTNTTTPILICSRSRHYRMQRTTVAHQMARVGRGAWLRRQMFDHKPAPLMWSCVMIGFLQVHVKWCNVSLWKGLIPSGSRFLYAYTPQNYIQINRHTPVHAF